MIQEHPVSSQKDAPQTGIVTVQVCVLTYKRPTLLRATLISLIRQAITEDSLGADWQLHMRILVIDNDAAMSGKKVTQEIAHAAGIPVDYLSEPARGLSNARNRALERSATMDFMAFIDDDEVAHPDWLMQLLRVASRTNADVITGPVHPAYANSPEWIKRGGFFKPQQRETGSTVPFVATNNVLIRGPLLRIFRFDSRFDATGGEDTDFFMRIARSGHSIVWSQDAVVTEHIPAERTNLRWLMQRARSDANRFTRSCLLVDRGPHTQLRRFGVACAGFLTGVAMLPAGIVGRHYTARGLQLISRSIGTITALRGRAQVYYKATDV